MGCCFRAILDPELFSIPGAVSTEQQALKAVESIIGWASALSGPSPIVVCKLRNTLELLAETSDYPVLPNVRTMLEMFNLLHVFSEHDVSKLLEDLLVRSKDFLDVSVVEVVETESAVLSPNPLPESIAEQIRSGTECTIATALMSACSRMGDGKSSYIACGDPSDLMPKNARITVAAIETSLPPEVLSAPLTVFGQLDVCGSPLDLLNSLESSYVWLRAEDNYSAVLAIALKMKEILYAMGHGCRIEELSLFWLGCDFLESVRALGTGGGEHASVILEACARLLIGHPKNEPLPFLDAPPSRGGKKQLVRDDSSKAYRIHVTKQHEALRLMAWNNAGVWELANIGPKGEEVILSWSYSEHIASDWIRRLLPPE